MGKTQIVWKYSNIELLLNIIENANSDIEELMSEIREQNRVLSDSMTKEQDEKIAGKIGKRKG